MAGTPDDRLPRQISDRATFVRALRTEGEKLILRLEDNDALATYRHNDELILLQFTRILPGQMSGTSWTGLGERFQVANDWIGNARHPAERTDSQKEIKEMAA